MMLKNPDRKVYLALLAKSYLEEQKDMMIGILEYTPELDAHIDVSGLESVPSLSLFHLNNKIVIVVPQAFWHFTMFGA